MDGEHDPDCRKSFPWDESKWDKNLLKFTRQATALRAQNPALRRGDYKRLWSANGVHAFSRTFEGQTVIVALNASETPQQVQVPKEAGINPWPIFGEASEISMNGKLKFTIPARSGVVFK